MKNKIFIWIFLSLLICKNVTAQINQTIRGKVVDNILQTPLAGATVIKIDDGTGTSTDNNGNFRLENINIGVLKLKVSFVGYKEVILDNIVVISGKETIITIPLEMAVYSGKEVIIRASVKSEKPLNDFSIVSARAFTVDETRKFAASVNDPSRMATNFPGVVAVNDGNNNDIVIRGNSPVGLLWRLEGVDIPNPNHFANTGSSSGAISILSGQLLANSDFLTGAFAADYGNALSGVFDLKLRKGNNEHPEYTVEAGFLGLNLAAEGPLKLLGNGSYLVNYRYSTLQLLDKAGLKLANGATNFQDLSYNIAIPTKRAGNFSLFGFGGISSLDPENKPGPRQGSNNSTGLSGLSHTISLNSKSSLASVISFSEEKIATDNSSSGNKVLSPNPASNPLSSYSNDSKESYRTNKLTLSTTYNYKFNNKSRLRAGLYTDFIDFAIDNSTRIDSSGVTKQNTVKTNGATELVQAFAEVQVKPVKNVTVTAGLHYLQLLLNNSRSIEPRASVRWDITDKSSLAFAYGNHSQTQQMTVYFAKEKGLSGIEEMANKNLGLTLARHYVLSYNYLLGNNNRFKTEVYYQQLYNVPVSSDPLETYSTLSQLTGDYMPSPLVNRGKGRNYGVEVSLEKNLTNNFYYLFSNSFYQSKYTASDGIEKNSRFNGNYISNLVIGKDFLFDHSTKRLGINLKTVYSGGFRDTPVDLAASQQQHTTVYFKNQLYSYQLPAYFRTDIRVNYQWNKKHVTSTLSLDIQNITNRENVFQRLYDPFEKKIAYQLSNGLIPVLNYKIEF